MIGIGMTGYAGLSAKFATFKVFVNGDEYKGGDALDVNGKTYLPLASLAKTLGVPVKWNGAKKQVELGSDTSLYTFSSGRLLIKVFEVKNTVKQNSEFLGISHSVSICYVEFTNSDSRRTADVDIRRLMLNNKNPNIDLTHTRWVNEHVSDEDTYLLNPGDTVRCYIVYDWGGNIKDAENTKNIFKY
jgi:hypothetical protein